MNEISFHGIIEKSNDIYTAVCLELDISTEGQTLQEAKFNLKEAVEGYLESVKNDNEEDEFIPRPVPEEVIEEYYQRFKTLLKSSANSEFYEFSEKAYASN
ncbi:MAG: hypothetical protein HQ522_00285 [Bacteroidetes bacterium]|nr:hypothetical protein [Bacteroidota bacterium]